MTTQLPAPVRPAPQPESRQGWYAQNRPFVIALAVAAGVRLAVQAAFMPAFIHSDGPTYLSLVHHLSPYPDRPVGYVILVLIPLSVITDNVLLVAIAQHLLGLATAVVLYLLIRRWGVGPRLAMVATLPILFDELQLNLEHAVMSDVLFEFLLVSGIAVLCWRRTVAPAYALAAGLLLGTSATVRLVGEPLILVPVLFCLLFGAGWRTRLAAAAAAAVGFALPVSAYAVWYHHDHGVYALSEFTGKSLYLRSTSFVDCSKISIPDYEQVLCPDQPLGQREDPTYYVFHDPTTLPELDPPPGVSDDAAMRDFAFEAMRAQPLDYTRIVVRDFFLNFDLWRGNRFEYDTASKWGFVHYVTVQPTAWTGPAYEAHGGEQLDAWPPLAWPFAVYQWVVYLPGPLLFGCMAIGLLGGIGVGRARSSGTRGVALLLTLTGAGLLLVPAMTAEFVWRYQLPVLVLFPAAAAIAWTAMRGGQVDEGTVATASTD